MDGRRPARAATAVVVAGLALIAPTSAAASDGGVPPALILSIVSATVAVAAFFFNRSKANRDEGAENARLAARVEAVERAQETLRREVLDKIAFQHVQGELAQERDRRRELEEELRELRAGGGRS